MKTYYSCLVGNNFRLAGSSVLPILPEGYPLMLEPEPDNAYDPNAVKVLADMTGHPTASKALEEGPLIHLGYLPRSGNSRTDKTGFGNVQALHILKDQRICFDASLTFSPEGNPLVRIEIIGEPEPR